MATSMQLSPYRRPCVALPQQLASCTDESVCRCNLARPRVLFAHRAWRWVWLGIAAFAGSAVTLAWAASLIPPGIAVKEVPRTHISRPASLAASVSHLSASSMFGGATHDPEVLLAQARAARDAGLQVTVIESQVYLNAADDLHDRIDLRATDQIVSVDGYTAGAPRIFEVERAGYGTIVIELLRGGRRVVMALRRGE